MPRPSPTRYLAFLRGINLGGRTVKMDALRQVFTALGFEQVKTLIASGNVSFFAPRTDPNKLTTTIEAALAKRFGFSIPVIIRTAKSMEALVAARPFGRVRVTPSTGLWVTLFAQPGSSAKPTHALHKNIKVAGRSRTEALCVITRDEGFGGTDAMTILEGHFGKNITTRTWNTIERLLAL